MSVVLEGVVVLAHRSYRLEAAAAIPGSIIRNIVAVRRIRIGRLRTGLADRLAETPWPIARLARDSRLEGRAEIWPAIAAVQE